GQSPYGHFPVEDDLKACGPKDADGEIRERIQADGRCESANPQGDTYGPVAFEAYLPGYLAFGWSGKWDTLPAAHASSIAFDLLCLLGLALVGRRFGGNRLAATLAFAWVAYPFTQYVSMSNTNDAIQPAFLIWGFWLASSAWARGAFSALASWTKFAPLHVLQLVLEVLLVVAAVAVAFVPRTKSPLQLAALTAALLIGFELVQTHWFYLYLPWFFPFVAFTVLAPSRIWAPVEAPEHDEHQ